VALTPAGVRALAEAGHRVVVERGAGAGSSFRDEEYARESAALGSVDEVWAQAELILKVKEPIEEEYRRMRSGQVLFTYLHLAPAPELARALQASQVIAIAYETVERPGGALPLLAPMSEVAGRLAVQVGGWCLQAQNGGRGILLSGAPGVRPGKVVIIGGGIAGFNACRVAAGVGAEVTILDVNPSRLRYLSDVLGGTAITVMSNRATLEEEIVQADLVIGTVLVAGARAPRLIASRTVAKMKPGAAMVDLSIDQGGISETSRPTTHAHPIYIHAGVVHYCVTNMPGAVPHTSTHALTNATLPYALQLADKGWRDALHANPSLAQGLSTHDGTLTSAAVAQAHDLPFVDPARLIG